MKRRAATSGPAATVMILAGIVPFALADETLDQFFDANWTNSTLWVHVGHNRAEERVVAQTFTVGEEGALSRVELLLALGRLPSPGPLILEIQSTTAGVPDGNVLTSASLPSHSFSCQPEFVSFVLDTPLPVQTGDVLGIVLRCDELDEIDSQWYFVIGKLGAEATYSRGRGFAYLNGTPWDPGVEVDFGFRTYLDHSPAVASASWSGVKALYRDTP